MREKYSCYEYAIFRWNDTGNPKDTERYVYSIYANDEIESSEWFGTEQEARCAAIGLINLLDPLIGYICSELRESVVIYHTDSI